MFPTVHEELRGQLRASAVEYFKKKRIRDPQIAKRRATEPTYELNGCETLFT